MDDQTLFVEIERLDAELSSVPIVLRQLDVYHALVGLEDRNEVALAYFDKISSWYRQKYGARAAWDGTIARQPVLIRGRLYILEVRHSSINPNDGLQELIETLKAQGPPVSPEEYRTLATSFLEGSGDFAALHNLEMRPSLLTAEQRSLARRAWFDLRNAAVVLENTGDVQGSIFHAHEAAEKFLKAGLIHEGYAFVSLGKAKLRHGLNEIVGALAAKHSKYRFLARQARDLSDLLDSMSARYTCTRRSLADAVEAFRLARHCCGFVASQIELDHDRGTRDITFQSDCYYEDYSGRQFRFCGYSRNDSGDILVHLYLLEASARGHTIDALVRFKAPCSFHYKAITDQKTIERLELRYRSLLRRERSNRDAPPISATVEKVHESLHAVASIQIPLNKGRKPL